MANVGLYGFIVLIAAAVMACVLSWILAPRFLWSNSGYVTTATVDNAEIFFNWHPTLMVAAYGFFGVVAIPAFQLLPGSHEIKKWYHALFHSLAVASSSLSIYVIYHYKDVTSNHQFYTVHDWIGIATFSAYCANYLGGLFAFIVGKYFAEKATSNLRAFLLPYHKFFGFVFWVGTVMSIVSGLLSKMWILEAFYPDKPYTSQSFEFYFPNIIALGMFVVFVTLTYALFYDSARRRAESNQYEALVNT